MILFTLLALTLLAVIVFSIIIISATGAAFIIVFADVIVCVAIIIWIMKILRKRKK